MVWIPIDVAREEGCRASRVLARGLGQKITLNAERGTPRDIGEQVPWG